MQRIYDTIENFQMIEPGMKILAGVSGGADSVCLLLALAGYRERMEFSLAVMHIEHGIRGQESLADACYVENFCRTLNVPCYVEHCDVQGEARRRGMTVEEAGRAVRYELFERKRQELHADRVAVAHNQNDQAETVLWNLVRGSGLRGLGGICPVRETVIRPLLFLERREIEELLRRQGISWRTDRTNLEPEYTRNRIRLQILPELERSLNAQAVSHISEAASRLREVEDYLEQETNRAAERCIGQTKEGRRVILQLASYEQEPPLLQKELLKRCLTLVRDGNGLKDVGSIHLEMLQELCRMSCGKQCDLPGQITAVRQRAELCFYRKEDRVRQQPKEVQIDAEALENSRETGLDICLGRYEAHLEMVSLTPELLDEIRKENKYTKWISYDTINSNACFRTRRPGDYLIVNENGGHRKLKDYLIDQKVPRDMRDQLWLLADGSHILWVTGYRISEAARVTEHTKKILKIQIKEDER